MLIKLGERWVRAADVHKIEPNEVSNIGPGGRLMRICWATVEGDHGINYRVDCVEGQEPQPLADELASLVNAALTPPTPATG